jgi:hypothetical protein
MDQRVAYQVGQQLSYWVQYRAVDLCVGAIDRQLRLSPQACAQVRNQALERVECLPNGQQARCEYGVM